MLRGCVIYGRRITTVAFLLTPTCARSTLSDLPPRRRHDLFSFILNLPLYNRGSCPYIYLHRGIAPHSVAGSSDNTEVAMTVSFSPSAGIVAKFATIANGVWIEQKPTPLGTTRVWRFDNNGNAEWACLKMLQNGDDRFYGSVFTQRDFILC